jgi:TrpR-related protein YerC/YecD
MVKNLEENTKNKEKEVNWDSKRNNQFLNESKDEAKRFLRDLMTVAEIEEFGKRLEAARLLSRDAQYVSIIELTGLSSTTVARISKWLKGPLGGYRLMLSKLSHHHSPVKLEKGLSLTRS